MLKFKAGTVIEKNLSTIDPQAGIEHEKVDKSQN